MSQRTLPDLLRTTAKKFPANGIGFIQPDKTIRFITYPMLQDQALRILKGLQNQGFTSGARVILSLETSEETLTAIWALFLGGMIPALLQPPHSFSEYNPALEKVERVYQILDNPYLMISHNHSFYWRQCRISESHLIDLSGLIYGSGSPEIGKIHPDDLAMIQFSSGSTGDPKGVMLTHRNIISNIHDISERIKLTYDDVSVSWMPLYHDMGLIGFHLTPTLTGCQQYFLEPADFVKNPLLWLDTLSNLRCTVTGCPNFGQALVNRSLRRKAGTTWDLSGLRVLFNGAEPISPRTMRDFLSALRGSALHPAAMFPAYGLAEATLAVTFPPPGREPEVIRFQRIPMIREGVARIAEPGETDVMELVNLGRALSHCSLRIVGEDGRKVPEGIRGSVQVQGDNVFAGYEGNREATEGVIADGWLQTGDLGFLFRGDLFIIGRSKDVIFVNGMNFYAHDLETATSSIEGIRAGKIVVTGYFDEKEGRDKLLVFLVGSEKMAIRETGIRIANHLKHTLGLNPDTFIPIRPGDIPRTSSGKIRRYKLVDRYLQGKFPVIRI